MREYFQQRTNVSVRLHTKIKWFDLPSPKNIDIGAIKEKNRHVWKGMLGSPRGGFFCTCRGPHRRSVEGLKGESSVEESLKEAELKSLCPESVAFSSSGPSTMQNTDVSDRIEEAIEGVKDDEERHLMKYLAKKQYLGHLMFMGELYQKID